jgi:molybdopterin-guanine dinucleotide biosynthesis protein A
MVNNVSGVILAGGANKRFNGIIKAKIVMSGKTIISRIIETLNDIFDEIIVVTNTPDEFKEFSNYKIIGDKFLNKGPLGGIHSALKETKKEAIFVFAADMPLLDRDVIIRQLNYYKKNKCDILIPQIGQKTEPLHGIYKKTITELLENYLEGGSNNSIMEILKKTDTDYMQMDQTEKNRRAFININSAWDLTLLKTAMD